MSKLTLPSGRVVELRAPSYGDVMDAEDASFASKRLNAYFEVMAARLSGLPLDEIRSLSVADGVALATAVRQAQKEAETIEAPLSNSSSTSPRPEQETP